MRVVGRCRLLENEVPLFRERGMLDSLGIAKLARHPCRDRQRSGHRPCRPLVIEPGIPMKRLLDLIAMSAGGWIGWMIGAWVSVFTAFLVSVVGTGVGLYVARRITKHYLP